MMQNQIIIKTIKSVVCFTEDSNLTSINNKAQVKKQRSARNLKKKIRKAALNYELQSKKL